MTATHAILILCALIAFGGLAAFAVTAREWWRMHRENQRISRRYGLGPDRWRERM